MQTRTASLIGATGLIGSHLLQQMMNDSHFRLIKVVVRRPMQAAHPKVQVIVVDFSDHASLMQAIAGSDVVFCAVGTTQQKVKGDKEAYRKVDYDIPVNAGKICMETGVEQFLLVSAVGADSTSSNFYLRLKGEVEDAVKHMNIPSVAIFRPSLLLGDRQEFRFGERVAKVLMKPFSFLVPSKYKPIHGEAIAKAMIAFTKQPEPGFNVYHYKEMKAKVVGV